MGCLVDALRQLVTLLRQLPGIGEKTASRLAFYILSCPPEYGEALSLSIKNVIEKVKPCKICGNLSELSPCSICSDPRRDNSVICIVEKMPDLLAIENSQEYRGLYHVLHGVLNPLEGTGPEQIGIEQLLSRLPGEVKEIILATSSSVEGEATALYLCKKIEPFGIKISRIASGIPVGGELEYVDRGTIGRAMSGRRIL
jgi:recombination protein RecR